MEHYVGIDVSLERSSVCVVDGTGKIVVEAKAVSEPEALIAWLRRQPFTLARIGLDAGPLSPWLFAGLRDAGFAAELLETRHVRDAFKAMPVKTDKKDARGIAQLMRLGWFKPVHCKSVSAGAGDPGAFDGTEDPAGEAPRRGDEPRSTCAPCRARCRRSRSRRG